MRSLLIAAGLLLLGACNMVTTKTPLFGPADAAGAPQLRLGVWRGDSDHPCAVSEARPIARWPDCANAFVVQSGQLSFHDLNAQGKPTVSTTPFVLAGASPSVLQATDDNPDAKADSASSNDRAYFYMGLRPTKTDPQGRITAFAAWSTLCGPPPPPDAKSTDGQHTRYGSLTPLPGLTMDKDENNCTTSSPDAVRAAAAASEKWIKPDSIVGAHWVRDGAR
jgi:hypothetical protein